MRPERYGTLRLTALLAAGCLMAVLHVAAIVSVAAHHHSEPGGSSSCLICAGAFSPASTNPSELSPALAAEIPLPVPPGAQSRPRAAAPGAIDVRAPPSA